MELKTWLEAERGRSASLARHLKVSPGRITQMADDGVPVKFIEQVSAFTEGAVPVDTLLQQLLRKPQKVA